MISTVKRLWVLLRRGYDPKYEEAEQRCERQIQDLQEMNGVVARKTGGPRGN